MSVELFDVVDELDRVVGQRPRSEVHRLGLRHRAVHVLVFDGAGRLFLQRRSFSKDSCPGMWDSSASGHLDAGEDYPEAASRELFEELGIIPADPPEPLFKIAAGPDTGMEFTWVYRAQWNGPFVLNPDEIIEGRWMPVDELALWIKERPGEMAGSFARVWREYGAWVEEPRH